MIKVLPGAGLSQFMGRKMGGPSVELELEILRVRSLPHQGSCDRGINPISRLSLQRQTFGWKRKQEGPGL